MVTPRVIGRDREESLRSALEMLGAEDEVAARRAISEAATELEDDKQVRVGDLAADLANIESTAAELADAWARYEDDLATALGSAGLEMDSPFLLDSKSPIEVIRALSQDAGRVRGHVVRVLGSGNPDRPDTGGASLTMQRFGTPKRRFVEELAYLWVAHRPDAVAAGADAPFAIFCEHIWAWTLGEEAGPPPGLDHDVKGILPRIRFCAALADRARQHEVAADNMARLGLGNQSAHFRRRAIRIYRRLARG